jgi:hypothetical protein
MFGLLSMLPWWLVGLYYAAAIAMCVHVHRSGQAMYWMWIILAFPPLGGLVYFVAILLPELTGGSAARRMGKAAVEALDPGRAYRTAKALYDDAPTVQNAMKLAQAAAGMSRWEEAEGLYAGASQGLYADDPALLQGRAAALLELGRPDEALEQLQRLEKDREGRIPPQAELNLARALHALGRPAEAEKSYRAAVQRVPGLEALARFAVFLADQGRMDEARDLLVEIDKRTAKTRAHFRKEAKAWRDFAAEKLAA